MKRTKVILGTMILAVGMAGAAWAQPAPDHDRDGRAYSYNRYRGDEQQRRGDRDDRGAWRGDGDRDDAYRAWNIRRDRDDRRVVRRDRDERGFHSNVRRDHDDR